MRLKIGALSEQSQLSYAIEDMDRLNFYSFTVNKDICQVNGIRFIQLEL